MLARDCRYVIGVTTKGVEWYLATVLIYQDETVLMVSPSQAGATSYSKAVAVEKVAGLVERDGAHLQVAGSADTMKKLLTLEKITLYRVKV